MTKTIAISIEAVMKPCGDISNRERAKMAELLEFEQQIEKGSHSKDRKAQIFVCLAYDWYQLEADEEGERLILQAEHICPGYFIGPMVKQSKSNKDFRNIVQKLKSELVRLMVDTLKH